MSKQGKVQMNRKININRLSRWKRRGLTLVEIVIAMGVMLIVLAAVLVNVSSSTNSGLFQKHMSRVMENGQVAINILSRNIRNAGYQQLVEVPDPLVEKSRFGQYLLGCSSQQVGTGAGVIDPWGIACGAASASDSIAVRFQGDQLSELPVIGTGNITSTIQLAQDCAGRIVSGSANQTDRGDGTTITIVDNRFFLAPNAVGDNTDLVCRGNGGDGSSVVLVPNIEQLRFWYGVTDRSVDPNAGITVLTAQTARYMTAAQLATTYGSEGDQRWDRVASVRICVVARSDKPVAAGSSRYIDCNGVAQTPADNFLRRTIYTTVDIPNVSIGL